MKLPQILFLLGGFATVNLFSLSSGLAMETESLAMDVAGLVRVAQDPDGDTEALVGDTEDEWCKLQTFLLNNSVKEISKDLDVLMSTSTCSLHRRARWSEFLFSDFETGLQSLHAMSLARCSMKDGLIQKLIGIESSLNFLISQVEREARMVSDPWLRQRLFESQAKMEPYLSFWSDLCWDEILEF